MNKYLALLKNSYATWTWQTVAAVFLFTAGTSMAAESQTLASIRSQAEEFVIARLNLDPAELEVQADQLDVRLRLANCNGKTEAYLQDGQRMGNRVAVGIRCLDETHRWSIFVPVNITRYAEVVVSSRNLSRGQAINKSDIKIERRAVSRLHGQYLTQVSQVIGQLPKRSLEKGKIVSPRLLKRQHLVKRGQNVIILAENPLIQVRSKGVALTNGRIGERIRVRNTGTKKIVEGTVTSEGYVKILL
jgi:flagella basal body P-ring formation protein FlgA